MVCLHTSLPEVVFPIIKTLLKQDLWVQEREADSSMKYASAALALAFFLDHMWQERPSKKMAASPWYEAASSLACKMLAAQVIKAPQVSCSIHLQQLVLHTKIIALARLKSLTSCGWMCLVDLLISDVWLTCCIFIDARYSSISLL